MRVHDTIRRDLYEYAAGELSGPPALAVEEHCAACPACARELRQMSELLAAVPRPTARPSGDRPPEFWVAFVADVERAVRVRTSRHPPPRGFAWRWRLGLAAGGALAAGVAAFLFLGIPPDPPGPTVQELRAVADRPVSLDDPRQQMQHLLRRSRSLLVGITNMKTPPNGSLDLSAEREVSRELISQARSLRGYPLDLRSERLLDDLERILIGLSNIEQSYGHPDVEIIRGGIRQENLLFKVRMAEQAYELP